LIKQVGTAERLIEAANMLLAIHQIEGHGANVVTGDPATELKPVDVADLRADLDGHLRKSESVWDTACSWSDTQFPELKGRVYSHAELQRQMENHLSEYPGLLSRKWLFVYSPQSMNTLFEVSGDFMRVSIAMAKLVTIAEHGGMIFGVDDSGEYRRVMPLAVCKPGGTKP
jgi:hypothetical protein